MCRCVCFLRATVFARCAVVFACVRLVPRCVVLCAARVVLKMGCYRPLRSSPCLCAACAAPLGLVGCLCGFAGGLLPAVACLCAGCCRLLCVCVQVVPRSSVLIAARLPVLRFVCRLQPFVAGLCAPCVGLFPRCLGRFPVVWGLWAFVWGLCGVCVRFVCAETNLSGFVRHKNGFIGLLSAVCMVFVSGLFAGESCFGLSVRPDDAKNAAPERRGGDSTSVGLRFSGSRQRLRCRMLKI